MNGRLNLTGSRATRLRRAARLDKDSDLRRKSRSNPGIFEHLASLTALLSVGVSSARIYAVSGYRAETAYYILQAGDTTKILAGLVLQLLPVGLATFGAIVYIGLILHALEVGVSDRIMRLAVGPQKDSILIPRLVQGLAMAYQPPQQTWVIVGGFAVALTATMGMLWLWADMMGVGLGIVGTVAVGDLVYVRFSMEAGQRKALDLHTRVLRLIERARFVGVVVFIALLIAFCLRPTPWMPLEQMKFAHRSTTVGYVISDDGPSLVLLRDDPRVIVRVPESQLVSRRPCALHSDRFAPRSERLGIGSSSVGPSYPKCP